MCPLPDPDHVIRLILRFPNPLSSSITDRPATGNEPEVQRARARRKNELDIILILIVALPVLWIFLLDPAVLGILGRSGYGRGRVDTVCCEGAGVTPFQLL